MADAAEHVELYAGHLAGEGFGVLDMEQPVGVAMQHKGGDGDHADGAAATVVGLSMKWSVTLTPDPPRGVYRT